jgi:predicted transcriptional regulator
MKLAGFSSPFGSQTRTRILVELVRTGRVWGRDLEEKFGTAVYAIQEAFQGLVEDGLIVPGERLGRTQLYVLNESYFAIAELRAYLSRLSEGYKTQGI